MWNQSIRTAICCRFRRCERIVRNSGSSTNERETEQLAMTIIPVPRPSQNAGNPDRPVSSLLLAQIQHLQHAERRLPLRYRSKIYTHAIKTEGEAARYIR